MLSVKEKLRKKGIPVTSQRISILKYISESFSHPTVERIFSDLSESMPALSRATVYNTLEAFVKCGLVRELRVDKEKARYEGTMREDHHHFYCTECKEVYDVIFGDEKKYSDVKEICGHKVNDFTAVFTGICRDCDRKNTNPGGAND